MFYVFRIYFMYQLVCQAVQNISAHKKVAFFLIVLVLTVMTEGGIKNDLMGLYWRVYIPSMR